MKLNTPGQKDGVMRLWLDGLLQCDRKGLDWRGVYKDHGRGGSLVSPETIAQHGFVFKRSEFTNRGDGAHGAMTHVYLRQLLKAERGSA